MGCRLDIAAAEVVMMLFVAVVGMLSMAVAARSSDMEVLGQNSCSVWVAAAVDSEVVDVDSEAVEVADLRSGRV
jgi:hypothetical protein